MTNIAKTIMGSLEIFRKKFINSQAGSTGPDPIEPVYELNIHQQSIEDIGALESHLLQSQIRLIDTIIEEMKSRKRQIIDNWASTHDRDGEQFTKLTKEDKGYNEAIADQISFLEETKKELTENL
jgi:hypothetical protein